MALAQLEKDLKRKIYLSISHGKVVHYLNEGGVEYFKNVSGTITDIYKKDRTFNGQRVPFWYIDIKDGEDLYSLSLPFISGTYKSIILSLASFEEITTETNILIEPYERNGFTKVMVYADSQKLDWVTSELPDLKEVEIKGKKYTDDSERMAFISSITEKVKNKLSNSNN